VQLNNAMSDDQAPISRTDLADLETRLLERVEKAETTLLREFRKYRRLRLGKGTLMQVSLESVAEETSRNRLRG
jgi:hypothetical protein